MLVLEWLIFHHFNEYYNKNLKLDENDYLNIYEVKCFEEIANYLKKPKDFCSHCNTKNTQKMLNGVYQRKK